MVNRRSIAVTAGVIALALLPTLALAGAGGTPTAPGAGRGTDYCCQSIQQNTEGQGKGEKSLNTVSGTGCTALDPGDTLSANQCPGVVVKCRGEFFTPSQDGSVRRCLTP